LELVETIRETNAEANVAIRAEENVAIRAEENVAIRAEENVAIRAEANAVIHLFSFKFSFKTPILYENNL
jgi:hypothetical protein